ncbi:hypothetical protein CC86DRAFT_377797 [Ophiobolus disseminans]|uniref:Uncharacterized protein n=1 Tax=Ophiobolus disseminans TaxID=1469910 RepID=A0A6A7AHA7_9PLEO|nr:hypothetical protein CC86DRAFT_377797 [Ophiobolus disseminans]
MNLYPWDHLETMVNSPNVRLCLTPPGRRHRTKKAYSICCWCEICERAVRGDILFKRALKDIEVVGELGDFDMDHEGLEEAETGNMYVGKDVAQEVLGMSDERAEKAIEPMCKVQVHMTIHVTLASHSGDLPKSSRSPQLTTLSPTYISRQIVEPITSTSHLLVSVDWVQTQSDANTYRPGIRPTEIHLFCSSLRQPSIAAAFPHALMTGCTSPMWPPRIDWMMQRRCGRVRAVRSGAPTLQCRGAGLLDRNCTASLYNGLEGVSCGSISHDSTFHDECAEQSIIGSARLNIFFGFTTLAVAQSSAEG